MDDGSRYVVVNFRTGHSMIIQVIECLMLILNRNPNHAGWINKVVWSRAKF